MDCPQCGAEVPSDDAFCGKCGYASRDDAPTRLDQSRIRVYEEPAPAEHAGRSSSQQRVRKHTVLGMPSATGKPLAESPATATAPVPPPPSPPPTPLSSARSGRGRTPQKTMLGIPRAELLDPAGIAPPVEPTETEHSTHAGDESGGPSEPVTPSHRVRARVRYDSANEPFPVIQRRKKALRGLAVLVVLAAAWLGYRFLTVNG